MKLIFDALSKYVVGFLILSVFLFVPAGSLDYYNAWLFLALLFIPMLILGIVMIFKSPQLLKKRLNTKEKQKTQKGVLVLSGIMFPLGFVICSLDFRFGWSTVPTWCVLISSLSLLLGYTLYAVVMKQNQYLSRTIEMQDDQKVIESGLYKIVRHPMYLSTILMFVPLPLILGSLWGLIPFGFYPIIIAVRIIDEEKFLTEKLLGYLEYKKKVKYRLIPYIW